MTSGRSEKDVTLCTTIIPEDEGWNEMAFFRGNLGSVWTADWRELALRTEGSRGGLKEAQRTKTRSDGLTIVDERYIRRATRTTDSHLLQMRQVASRRGQNHVERRSEQVEWST